MLVLRVPTSGEVRPPSNTTAIKRLVPVLQYRTFDLDEIFEHLKNLARHENAPSRSDLLLIITDLRLYTKLFPENIERTE